MLNSKKQLKQKYAYKGDFHLFKGVWQTLGIFEIALLCISLGFSFKYYEVGLFQVMAGEYAYIPAIILSAGISYCLLTIGWRVFAYWHQKGFPPTLPGLMFVGLLALNCLADFKGSPMYSVEFLQAPSKNNEAANKWLKQKKAVEAKMQAIFNKYCWAGKCHETIAQVRNHTSKFGHTPKGDAKALEALEAEKQIYIKNIQDSNARFGKNHEQYAADLEQNQGLMKGSSIAVTLAFLIVSFWRTSFAVSNAKKKDKKKKAKAPKNPQSNQTDQLKAELNLLREKLNNPDLLEEQLAKLEQQGKS